MPITNWPKEDRPREKLLLKGEQALTDAELIAIFIKTGIRGKTAVDIAKELLTAHGGLHKLIQLPPNILMNTPGVGLHKYAALKAAFELGKRCLATSVNIGEFLNSTKLAEQFLAERLRYHENEVFACAYLNTHYRLLGFEELFHGTVHETSIYPREIVRRGLYHNAAKVILAHNHPSGQSLPSEADKEVTKQIKQALALVDIQVVDHIIIGHPHHFSFAECHLL